MGKIKQAERFSGDRKFLPKSKEESVNPSDKFLKESIDLLKRDFGQPLPTLKSVMVYRKYVFNSYNLFV